METLVKNPNSQTLPSMVDVYCQTRADYWQEEVPGVDAQAIRTEMEINYDLLEPVDERADTEIKPSITVCIPVALLHEDQDTIDRTLDAIHKSQEASGEPVEVIVWSNTVETAKPVERPGIAQRIRERRANKEINQRYQNLRDSFRRFDGSGLIVKTALEVIPEQDFSISQIRSNYMEAVAVNAEKNDYGSDHPILWLDADTTYMSRETLGTISQKLNQKNTLFVHASERYTTEWADGKPMSERDDATKAIMINEIQRRKLAKQAMKSGSRTGYPEESGLAFTVGTYLRLGGVNTQSKVNESANLISYGKELLLDGQITRERNTLGYGRKFPKDVPGVLEYIPSARIGISARRQQDLVQARGARALRFAQQGFGEYELHAGAKLEKDGEPPRSVSREEMNATLKAARNREKLISKGDVELDEAEHRILYKLIEKNFKD